VKDACNKVLVFTNRSICRDQLNGDLAPANGDAYFIYGQALLQYAIEQNTVLGHSAQASAKVVEKQQEKEKEEQGNYFIFCLFDIRGVDSLIL
jgi:hypothetical protein